MAVFNFQFLEARVIGWVLGRPIGNDLGFTHIILTDTDNWDRAFGFFGQQWRAFVVSKRPEGKWFVDMPNTGVRLECTRLKIGASSYSFRGLRLTTGVRIWSISGDEAILVIDDLSELLTFALHMMYTTKTLPNGARNHYVTSELNGDADCGITLGITQLALQKPQSLVEPSHLLFNASRDVELEQP